MLLEQLERLGGVDLAQGAEAVVHRESSSPFSSAARKYGSSTRRARRSRLLERDRGRQRRHRAVGRFARSDEGELPLLGLPGRDSRPALKPEALGPDQQVGPVGKDPFQQEAALGIRRGRGLDRGEKHPRTGDRLTLAVVDQPDQFAALLKSKRRNGRQLGPCRQRLGVDGRVTLGTDDDPVCPAGHELRRRPERAIGPGADRPRIEVNETGLPPGLGLPSGFDGGSTGSPPRPRPGRSPPAGPSR